MEMYVNPYILRNPGEFGVQYRLGEAYVRPAGAFFSTKKPFWVFLDMSHLGKGRLGPKLGLEKKTSGLTQ